MRSFIKELQIPLYFSFHSVQFHDTLNALIRRVYIRLHEKDVADRRDAIETKKLIKEKLKGLDAIEKSSKAFWEL